MGAKNKITENSVKLPPKKRGNKGKTRQDIELQHRIEDEILSLILDKNYSLNTSYVTDVVSYSMTQSTQNNMIWNYN